jgi:hypothetical protein
MSKEGAKRVFEKFQRSGSAIGIEKAQRVPQDETDFSRKGKQS